MEDNSETTNNQDNNTEVIVHKKGFSFTKLLLRLLVLAIIGGGGYWAYIEYGDRLGFNKEFKKEVRSTGGAVTNVSYNGVTNDSLVTNIDSTDIVVADSTDIAVVDSSGTEEVNRDLTEEVELEKEKEGGFFDVNTAYNELEAPAEAIREAAIVAHDQEIALEIEEEQIDEMIEEIIAPMKMSETESNTFKKFYKEDILSSGSVIKLIAVTGNHFLGGEDTSFDKDILDALLLSEEVVSILIIDRNGKVVYSTDRKQMNRSIKALKPSVDLSAQSLVFSELNGLITVTVPLFKGYGRNGTALLITKSMVQKN